MARGITQAQVDQAADAIVATGERPTVEKVRGRLGTGSPNTVTRMLDTWRQGLAERLHAVNALPELPDAVSKAMTGLWSQALEHARAHTERETRAERDALQRRRMALDAEKAEQAANVANIREELQRAQGASRQASAEVEALQRLVERLEAAVKDKAQQCERLSAGLQAAAATEATLRERIQLIEAQAAEERSRRDAHIQAVEDRAHTQVDQARTDLKATRAELVDTRREHRKEIQMLQQELAVRTRSLGVAERDVAHQRGVAEALKLKLSRKPSSGPARRASTSARRKSARPGRTPA